jgi:succinyl-CoA synthetase beta subunit
LDAKILFDDNAEFRQKDVFGLRDRTQEDKSEVEAAAHNLVRLLLFGTGLPDFSWYNMRK